MFIVAGVNYRAILANIPGINITVWKNCKYPVAEKKKKELALFITIMPEQQTKKEDKKKVVDGKLNCIKPNL